MKIKRMRLRAVMISFTVCVLSGLIGFPCGLNSGDEQNVTNIENAISSWNVITAEALETDSTLTNNVNSVTAQSAFVLSPYGYNFADASYTQSEIAKLDLYSSLLIYRNPNERDNISSTTNDQLNKLLETKDGGTNNEESQKGEEILIEEEPVDEDYIEKDNVDQLVEIAANVIFSTETSAEYGGEIRIEHYQAINPNDNGSLSIGRLQWHGIRAKKLLQKIYETDPELFDEVLEKHNAESLKRDVLDDSKWKRYRLRRNGYYYNAIKELLGTDVGIRVQDEMALADVKEYIEIGIRDYGITKPQSLVYFADLANQYGVYSDVVKKVVHRAKSRGSTTIDDLFESTKSVTTKYRDRRKLVYNTINEIKDKLPSIDDYINNIDE